MIKRSLLAWIVVLNSLDGFVDLLLLLELLFVRHGSFVFYTPFCGIIKIPRRTKWCKKSWYAYDVVGSTPVCFIVEGLVFSSFTRCLGFKFQRGYSLFIDLLDLYRFISILITFWTYLYFCLPPKGTHFQTQFCILDIMRCILGYFNMCSAWKI